MSSIEQSRPGVIQFSNLRVVDVMSGYRLELGVAGVDERLELTAEDDNAARRQALLTMGDMLRDQAIRGVYGARVNLVLFNAGGGRLYEVHVAAA